MSVSFTGAPWREADQLFRSDPGWLGSDDAYTIDLGNDRTLWLFGDTFVGSDRATATFVRNSIGIQHGADPSRASIDFHWGDGPSSFFSDRGDTWLWPLHGARINGALLLFFMHVRSSRAHSLGPIGDWRADGPLGFFDVFSWIALVVEGADGAPAAWTFVDAVLPAARRDIVLGAAVVIDGGHLYGFGWRAREVFVARWPLADAAAGRLGGPRWWCGGGWETEEEPAPLFDGGTTEFTVHRDGTSGRFVLTQTTGVHGARIAVRTAARPEGPWSDPVTVFAPEESTREDAFVYAAKSHPHLEGADLVMTYATVGSADTTLTDDSIYFPRFVRTTATR